MNTDASEVFMDARNTSGHDSRGGGQAEIKEPRLR